MSTPIAAIHTLVGPHVQAGHAGPLRTIVDQVDVLAGAGVVNADRLFTDRGPATLTDDPWTYAWLNQTLHALEVLRDTDRISARLSPADGAGVRYVWITAGRAVRGTSADWAVLVRTTSDNQWDMLVFTAAPSATSEGGVQPVLRFASARPALFAPVNELADEFLAKHIWPRVAVEPAAA